MSVITCNNCGIVFETLIAKEVVETETTWMNETWERKIGSVCPLCKNEVKW